MKIYRCERCNSTDVFIKYNGPHCGLYCGDCGKWIKWLNQDEERLALRQIDAQTENKKIRANERRKTIDALMNKVAQINGISDEDWNLLEQKAKWMKGAEE